MRFSSIELEDADWIADSLIARSIFPKASAWLITGASGFIGSQLLNVLRSLRTKGFDLEVTVVDNGIRGGVRDWYYKGFNVVNADVSKAWNFAVRSDYVVHLASIASPVFYREFPLETLDANINGTRFALDCAREWNSNLLILSSSEIYGDPDEGNIPTGEKYRGNVDCTGPRACYDESKRLAETLAWIFQNNYQTNVSVARPFNFYGPGMRLDDGRILPDLFSAVSKNEDIVLHSDGSPTRTFCYIRDAVEALMLIVLNADKQGIFNVGNSSGEISMKELAESVASIGKQFGWTSRLEYAVSKEKNFLVNNPQRRAPITSKIEIDLDWEARTQLGEGIKRSLQHFSELGIQ